MNLMGFQKAGEETFHARFLDCLRRRRVSLSNLSLNLGGCSALSGSGHSDQVVMKTAQEGARFQAGAVPRPLDLSSVRHGQRSGLGLRVGGHTHKELCCASPPAPCNSRAARLAKRRR